RGHAGDTGLDDKVCKSDFLFAVAQRESVQSAKIFRNDNLEFDLTIASNLYFGDDAFSWLESIAADAATCESLPHELERSNTGETLTPQHRARSDGALRRAQGQPG